jgi:hypothetical protein
MEVYQMNTTSQGRFRCKASKFYINLMTQVNATHLLALKSLCKCEHLKALFIAFTKNLRFFACVNPFKIIYHISLYNRMVTGTDGDGQPASSDFRGWHPQRPQGRLRCTPSSSLHLTHRRLCSLPSFEHYYSGKVIHCCNLRLR